MRGSYPLVAKKRIFSIVNVSDEFEKFTFSEMTTCLPYKVANFTRNSVALWLMRHWKVLLDSQWAFPWRQRPKKLFEIIVH